MKTNLTRKFSFLLLLLTGVVSYSNAQTFFEITAPASAIATYPIVETANWGGDLPDCLNNFTLNGEIEVIADDVASDTTGVFTDGCEMAGNDLTGKIALVDRGTCNFSVKALNAQNAGAIAVIICNNDAGTTLPNPMGAGLGSADVTIPVLGLEFDQCAAFRSEIPVVTGNLFYMTPPAGSDVVLWGANVGEGDFSGGLNGWTTVDISCANAGDTPLWVYSAEATATGGAFSAGGGVSQANTACNGAMAFDSDFYDNDGDDMNLGGGACTAIQIGELISPAIDLSAVSAGVAAISIKWHQALREFNSTHFISYSNDNGSTWFDVQVNDDLETNGPHINETRRAILPDADLSSTQFRVKFRYEANYYYWIIDDVQLIEAESNNLQVNDNFYAIPPNALTPTSQLEGFSFLADIENVGAADQPNTILNINIADAGGASVYTDDLSYGTTVADSLYENVPFAGIYTPVGDAGDVFTGTYSISSDSVDFDESNNSISFDFALTDTTFAKDLTGPTFGVRPADASWTGDMDPHSWAYGCLYHIVNGSDVADPNNMKHYASSVSFAVEALPAGEIVTAYLYRWEDLNEDGDMDIDERERIGVANLGTTASDDASNLKTLQLQPFSPNTPGEPGRLELESNTNYVVMVEYLTSTLGLDMEVSAANAEYNAQVLRNSLDDLPDRTAVFLGVGAPNATVFTAGSFENIVPSARLHLRSELVIDVNELDAANIINVMPNPADDFINLSFDLVNAQADVQVNIVDVTGKVVLNTVYENVTKETFRLNTSKLTAGAYFINVITEDGVRAERLIIQR